MEIAIFLMVSGIFLMMLSELIRKDQSPLISRTKERVLVDTSILIDGRFLAVAKTGFVNFEILIPRSVVGELQTLADGGNDEKRVRARYGLDVISALQEIDDLKVSILADGNFAKEGVDNRLLSLAKKLNAAILTADYNLNKVAKVEGTKVLNINELVQSVRASYLPGEKIMLEITQKGNEKKQGIGHLPDGTMVVVEAGEGLVGTTSEVEFIRSLQTAAGKMMFARVAGTKKPKIETVAKTRGRAPVQKAKEEIKKVAHSPRGKKASTIRKNAESKAEEKPILAEKVAKNSKKSPAKTQKSSENKISAQKKSPERKAPSKRRRTQKSAEASLVDLANEQSE